ncbi:hypothetical protein F5876DRAFT_70451 [Lentinula aff. lateritia]|uniref:Uncharacterized protein n=1 Tax=Lentinula aff. lateritia TaxID=2804960 RepID=A0ACC1TIT8_9AGAR|nr:hypothetical protein F5876DRAFT_70451 [Lentinula aff. lateritia]
MSRSKKSSNLNPAALNNIPEEDDRWDQVVPSPAPQSLPATGPLSHATSTPRVSHVGNTSITAWNTSFEHYSDDVKILSKRTILSLIKGCKYPMRLYEKFNFSSNEKSLKNLNVIMLSKFKLFSCSNDGFLAVYAYTRHPTAVASTCSENADTVHFSPIGLSNLLNQLFMASVVCTPPTQLPGAPPTTPLTVKPVNTISTSVVALPDPREQDHTLAVSQTVHILPEAITALRKGWPEHISLACFNPKMVSTDNFGKIAKTMPKALEAFLITEKLHGRTGSEHALAIADFVQKTFQMVTNQDDYLECFPRYLIYTEQVLFDWKNNPKQRGVPFVFNEPRWAHIEWGVRNKIL